jgi:fumarylacetoacetate (FAA) hydrolase family protein
MTTGREFPGTAAQALPSDHREAVLVGRAWRPDVAGPSVVTVRDEDVYDISRSFATMRDLCQQPRPAQAAAAAEGERIGTVDELLGATPADAAVPYGPGCCPQPASRPSRHPA